jgi:hypothetical protein
MTNICILRCPCPDRLRKQGTFTTFSPICFFNLLDMKISPIIILFVYWHRVFNNFNSREVKASACEWKDLGFESHRIQSFFLNKAVYCVMLHFYLQHPGIIKMFLLCNIPGKVPLFFLYKQYIMRINCMQNITKYYVLLRNDASVLKCVKIRSTFCASVLSRAANANSRSSI